MLSHSEPHTHTQTIPKHKHKQRAMYIERERSVILWAGMVEGEGDYN